MCTSSIGYSLGIPAKTAYEGKDTDFSAVWLTRDLLGLAFLDQVDLMDMSDLLELSKGLSKIGAKILGSTVVQCSDIKVPLSVVQSSDIKGPFVLCYYFN